MGIYLCWTRQSCSATCPLGSLPRSRYFYVWPGGDHGNWPSVCAAARKDNVHGNLRNRGFRRPCLSRFLTNDPRSTAEGAQLSSLPDCPAIANTVIAWFSFHLLNHPVPCHRYYRSPMFPVTTRMANPESREEFTLNIPCRARQYVSSALCSSCDTTHPDPEIGGV